ncbi:MAG: phosphopantothenate--cysteine ligase [Clostridiales Family XIII bacterium]|jgi:phosphopantothenate-cysteine ligase|nr:phosphopantothenate--cysteine ligase [Clostridiales Family XIII bacterium]
MNILITAGGTTEKIDEVRAITNTGTGMLGALIADRFAAADPSNSILYICSKGAVRPSVPAEVLIANDTVSLEWTVRKICGSQRIDVIIHSMAISDYRTKAVSDPVILAERIAGEIKTRGAGADEIADLIVNAPPLGDGAKIRSDRDNVVVVLEKTPKIIAMFRELQPESLIVGFKLLAGAPQNELLAAGRALLEKNGCDFVFANDMRTVSAGKHSGYLIDANGTYKTAAGKEAIADLIVGAVTEIR